MRSISYRGGGTLPGFITAATAILLGFVDFGRNNSSRRCFPRIEDQTRVADVEKDGSEDDHPVR